MKIQIFKTGKQTDSAGRERDWSAADLDQIAAAYNPAAHEAPVVIGHPKDNAPAFGWVEKVWRDGETLWAGLKDLVPEFVDLVKKGLFKKRSISLYPDLTLRHVGFLGAMPPAVKGLADIQFSTPEGGCATYEFEETLTPEGDTPAGKEAKNMTFKEWLSGIKKTLLDLPEDQIPTGEMPKTFSEEEVQAREEAARKQAEEETKAKAAKEFAEAARQKRQDGLKTEISAWCEAMVAKGQITPAWVKFGLPELLFQAGVAETEIEFGEEKTKAEPLARWKDFFEKQLPAVVNFKEIATRDKDAGSGNAGEKLTALAQAEQNADKNLSFSQALTIAQTKNPDLAREYAQEMRGGN